MHISLGTTDLAQNSLIGDYYFESHHQHGLQTFVRLTSKGRWNHKTEECSFLPLNVSFIGYVKLGKEQGNAQGGSPKGTNILVLKLQTGVGRGENLHI